MASITIGVAFFAGLVSFLSPCVLPLIPGFLAYLAGTSLENAPSGRIKIFTNTVFFVVGIVLVYTAAGFLLNSLFLDVSYSAQYWLSKAAGIIIIFFGIYLTGVLKLPLLEREYKIRLGSVSRANYLSSFLLGAAFAVGWSPCVGPILGSIIVLAATQPGSALVLLLTYSIGLGLPFLLVGLFVSQAAELIRKYAGALRYMNVFFGLIMVIIGWLVFNQRLSVLINIR